MSDNNNLPQKKDNAALALQKTGSLLSITDKILANRTQTKAISKPQQRIGKFIVKDGIATDTETSLTWLRFEHGQRWQNNTTEGESEDVSWQTAFEIAKQFNQCSGYAGFTDWRLPTIDELKTLLEEYENEEGRYIDAVVFPHCGWRAWSSSLNTNFSGFAWIAYFYDGGGSYDSKYGSFAVRLVRSGQ